MAAQAARSIEQIEADLAPLEEQYTALSMKVAALRGERDRAQKQMVNQGKVPLLELIAIADGSGEAAHAAYETLEAKVKATHPMLYSWGRYGEHANDGGDYLTWFAPAAMIKHEASDDEVADFCQAVTALLREMQPTKVDLGYGEGPQPWQIDIITDQTDPDAIYSVRIYVDLDTDTAELTTRSRPGLGMPEAEGTLADVIKVASRKYWFGNWR